MLHAFADLNYGLEPHQAEIRRLVRDFAEGEVAPVAEALDRESRFPYALIAQLAELGLMAIPIAERWGGAGLDTLAYAVAIEELARIDSSVAITVAAHTSLGTSPLALFGTDAQRERWLPELTAGRRLAAFGLTEPDAGSDAGGSLRTTAREQPDGSWVINGSKMFITNAGTEISGLVSITALTGEREISNLVVENGTPGYEPGPPLRKMGWHASDTRPLGFGDCRVDADHLLGPRGNGFRQFLQILDGGRISVGAIGLGLAQGVYEQSVRYAAQRHQFGRPIGAFQAIQFKLAEMATEIELARNTLYKAARMKDAGLAYGPTAAIAKLYTGELAVRAANEAVEIHGGYGYIDEYPVSRFYRDAKVLDIGEGTIEIQKMVIGRAVAAA